MADISFFDPRSEKENARRRKQAEILLEKGRATPKNEQAGGMTVLRSPWENINQAAQVFVGERDLAAADESDAELEKARQGRIAEALKQWGTNPQAAAEILGGDPRTSEMAAKILMGGRDNKSSVLQINDAIKEALERGDIAEANRLERLAKTVDRGINQYGNDSLPPMRPPARPPVKTPPFNPSPNAAPPIVGGGFTPDFQPPPVIPSNGVQTNNPYDQPDPSLDPYPVSAPVNIYDAPPPARPIPAPAPVAGYGEALGEIGGKKKAGEGRGAEIGKRRGENEVLYRSMVSRMPQLNDMAERLSKLGQVATYTMTGRAFNAAAREAGFDLDDAAQARQAYISMVDNEILPLLRDTFGAQFTQKEGETLRATLGDPNLSPPEKDARIRAFITNKVNTIESLRREMDYGETIPDYQQPTINIGGQGFDAPIAGDSPSPSNEPMTRESVTERLKAAGYTPEEIQEYLANRGL